MTDVEVPWPASIKCEVDLKADQGWIYFHNPKTGERMALPVTTGDADARTRLSGGPVWHIAISGKTATITPSIHIMGDTHSPNPVAFTIVKRIPPRKR